MRETGQDRATRPAAPRMRRFLLTAMASVLAWAAMWGTPAEGAGDSGEVHVLAVATGDTTTADLEARVGTFTEDLASSAPAVRVGEPVSFSVSEPTKSRVDGSVERKKNGDVTVSWAWDGEAGGLPAWAEVALLADKVVVGIVGHEPTTAGRHTFDGRGLSALSDDAKLSAEVTISNAIGPETKRGPAVTQFGLQFIPAKGTQSALLDWSHKEVEKFAAEQGGSGARATCSVWMVGEVGSSPREAPCPDSGQQSLQLTGAPGERRTAVLEVRANGKAMTSSTTFVVPGDPPGSAGGCGKVRAPSEASTPLLERANIESAFLAGSPTRRLVTATDADTRTWAAETCSVFRQLEPELDGPTVGLEGLELLAATGRTLRPPDAAGAFLQELGLRAVTPSTQTSPPAPSVPSTPPAITESAAGPAGATDGSAIVVLIGIAILVLGAGVVVALVLRRRSRPSAGGSPAHETVNAPARLSPLPTHRSEDLDLSDLVAPGPAAPASPEPLVPPVPSPGPPDPTFPSGSIHIGIGEPHAGADARSMAHDGRRLEPVRSDDGWVWGHEEPGLVVSGLWLERRAGKGEDAQPTFVFDPVSGKGLLATYDGTGGSGAAPAQIGADGEDVSGAFVAGRLARRVTEAWFAGVLAAPSSDAAPDMALHDELAVRFAHEATLGTQSSAKFAGSLRRELPTTLAATRFRVGGATVSAAAIWAGDSRCHVLLPDSGLQQLTVDDTSIHDALEAITTDAPMTNLVSADRSFQLGHRTFEFATPVVLVSSTDGCFGYVATPAHFEYLLLEALQSATTADEWAARMLAQLENFTGDDASLVLVAVGWRDLDEVKRAFADRTAHLQLQHWAPFAHLQPADHDQLTTLRMTSWRQYKQLYEEHLPRPAERSPSPVAVDDPPETATDSSGLDADHGDGSLVGEG